jgi:hypothetical protein
MRQVKHEGGGRIWTVNTTNYVGELGLTLLRYLYLIMVLKASEKMDLFYTNVL